MYFKTIGRMSEQCHNVHKYLSIILHSCNSEVEYLTFPVILEHRSLHSTDEPALFTTKLSQVASLTSLILDFPRSSDSHREAIVAELVPSLTRLSFPLVRFRNNL